MDSGIGASCRCGIGGSSLFTDKLYVLRFFYFSLKYYSPADPEVEIYPSQLAYFQNSYNDCRKAFILQAENLLQNLDLRKGLINLFCGL